MTVSYVNIGAVSSGATSITPAYPASTVAGDLAIMVIATAHPLESIPSVPAGWQLIDTQSGGGGAFGSGTGPRRLSVYTKILAASNTAPTVSVATGTGSAISGRILALHSSTGAASWRYATSLGAMTTASTSFSAAGVDNLTYGTNDFVILANVVRASAITYSAQGATASGVTFGARTERSDDSVVTGNGLSWQVSTCSITTGTGTTQNLPTITATLSVSATGVGLAVRIRESTVTIAVAPQTATPPRNNVTVNNMLTEEISSASINRVIGQSITPLRGAQDVDVTGQNALVRVDGEMPFGVQVAYQAILTDSLGDQWSITSTQSQVDNATEVLSDATLGIGVNCRVIEWLSREYTRETTEFNVSGRIVVVSGPQTQPISTLIVYTESLADRDAMFALLDNATNSIIQMRTHALTSGLDPTHAQVDGYLQLRGRVLEQMHVWRMPSRHWELDVVGGEPWLISLEARGFTLQSIANYFVDRSLQAIADQFTTNLLSLATFDWSI